MASPIDLKWANDEMSDATLDKVTYGQGSSFPSTWPTTRIFWRTDEDLLYYNSGTEGTPVWTPFNSFSLEDTEQSTTPVVDDSEHNVLNEQWYGENFTLPTTFPFYRITFVEIKTGVSGSGNFVAGVSIIDKDPPVSGLAFLAAYTTVGSHASSTTIKQAIDKQLIVLGGGQTLKPWINANASSGYRRDILANENIHQNIDYVDALQPFHDETWISATTRTYLKVYFKGYGKIVV